MFQVHHWPNAILHLDGDAFFASVIQAVYPKLKGKPVVTGQERGIATAISYEAKKYGITRGMRMFEIKKLYPQCHIMDSNYELYDLFSKRMFAIVRSFTPYVEEYSIDEAFADIKGLRRPINKTYGEIAQAIKDKIESSLGISVSVGVSLTKSLAKLASSSHKPSGLMIINGRAIEYLLQHTPVEKVWGIGENTAAYLHKLEIYTALEFANQSEGFVISRLTKPFFEIWQELRGNKVYELDMNRKTTYRSITRSQTFHPPTNDPNLLRSRLLGHVEDAFKTARDCHYQIAEFTIFLKTQEFRYHVAEIKLPEPTSYPLLIRQFIHEAFKKAYKTDCLYRTTGCTLTQLKETAVTQQALFTTYNDRLKEKVSKIYPLYEAKKVDFGSMFFDKQSVEEKKKKHMSLPVIEI